MNAPRELQEMLAYFPDGESLVSQAELISFAETPEPFKRLLVHEHHMTVTMEQFHGCAMTVEVLNRKQEANHYYRHIVLRRSDNQAVTQFGIVRFDLSTVSPDVANAIVSEQIPLGRILIQSGVFLSIQLDAVLKITPGPRLQQLFSQPAPLPVFGRLAKIFCEGRLAVDLLEVAAP